MSQTKHDKELIVLRSAQAKAVSELDDGFVARCAAATGLDKARVDEIVRQVRDAKTAKPVARKPRMSAYDALVTEGHGTYDASDRYDASELAHPTDY